MKNSCSITAILSLTIVMSCGLKNQEKTNDNLAETPPLEEGFVALFDGKTLDGWHTYGKESAKAAWSVEDGSIAFNPKVADDQRGDIVTDKEYKNFDLKLDWKISKEGNSGIIFLVNEDTTKYAQTYMTGLEMQVLDNEFHPDAKITKHRAGDLYDLISCSEETVQPAGEWNQAQIICKDDSLTLFLNDKKVIETSIRNQKWKEMIASSKFKEWADFGTFTKGHIALQDHGNPVWYRNIRIKEL